MVGLLLISRSGQSRPPTVDFPTGFAMNCGGSQYTSPVDGEIFEAEDDVTVSSGSVYTTGAAFANTGNQTVIQTQRWGVFQYDFVVPNGSYFVTLGLGENYNGNLGAGQREHTYTIEGATMLSNYDVQAEAAIYTLVEKTFLVTVADELLTIAAVDAGLDVPSLGYIRVTPDAGTAPGAIDDLAAVAGDTTVTLTFTKPHTATGVRVFRSTSSPVTAGDTDLGLQISTFVDTGRSNGTTYYYAVRAENTHGNAALSNEESAIPAGAGSESGIVLYVTTSGNDANDGSNNTTQALLTLAGARNQLRVLTNRTVDGTSTPTPAGDWSGATIIFSAGTYPWALPGSLTTRTSDSVGVVTTTDTHGLDDGKYTIGVRWNGGARTGCTITAVGASTVSFSGGSGTNLPSASAALTLLLEATFDERDGGTSGYPVIYDLSAGAKFTGAYQVSDGAWALASVAGGTPYARLPDATDQDTYRLDVGGLGIDTGDFTYALTEGGTDNWLRLIDGDTMMTMSRYPNGTGTDPKAWDLPPVGTQAGWLPAKSWTSTTITLEDNTPSGYAASGQHIRIEGSLWRPYITSWANASGFASSASDTVITTDAYSIGTDLTRPFLCIRNALEALDTAGEYVWYQPSGLLYYLPVGGGAPTGCSLTLATNLIQLGVNGQAAQACDHVTFRGGIMEGTRNGLILAYHCTGLTLDGVELRNAGGQNGAFLIYDATDLLITGCSVHDLPIAAGRIHGGDKDTITAANIHITDTDFADIGFDAFYRVPALALYSVDSEGPYDGCGVTIDGGCTFTNIRQEAIRLTAMNVTISGNVFDRCVGIGGDMGAIMQEYRLTGRNTVISGNTFRHMRRVGDVAGTANDWQAPSDGAIFTLYLDLMSDVTVADNVFEDCDQAMNIAGGKEIALLRNKFTDCSSGHYGRPIVWGSRVGHAGTPLTVLTDDLNATPLSGGTWTAEWPLGVDYLVGGARRAVTLYHESIICRDNMATNGTEICQIRWGTQPQMVGAFFAGVGGVAGSLTTRTSDTAGTLTLSTGHGITTGQTVSLEWKAGSEYPRRTYVTVGTVAGNSVPFTGGSGTVLPSAGTALIVWLHTASFLNYPMGATGTPVASGGTVPLGLISWPGY